MGSWGSLEYLGWLNVAHPISFSPSEEGARYCHVPCEKKYLFPLPPTLSLFCRLLDSFDVVPGHLTEDLHLYSLNDLTAAKKGELGPRLAELTRAGAAHVERCMVRWPCSALQLRFCLGLRWGRVLALLLQKPEPAS